MSIFPYGSYPYGYHLEGGYPIERDNSRGLEATLSFVGPSARRWHFIEEVFGRWGFEPSDPDPPYTPCCFTLLKPPRAYSIWMEDLGNFYNSDVYRHLWPDNFEISPIDDPTPYWRRYGEGTLLPYYLDVENLKWLEGYGGYGDRTQTYSLLEAPVDYDCLSRVVVNYRGKYHAEWPGSVRNDCLVCVQSNPADPGDEHPECCQYPTIPEGTFIDVAQRSEAEYQTIPGRLLKYGNDPDWPNDKSKQLDIDVDAGIVISSTNLQVEWSNVPRPPKVSARKCRGKLNSKPFLTYPRGSVLLRDWEIVSKIPFYGADHKAIPGLGLYTMVYEFVVKTVPSWQAAGSTNESCFGMMGYYNRRWSADEIDNIAAVGGGKSPFRKVVDANGNTPYEYADFDSLFELDFCP